MVSRQKAEGAVMRIRKTKPKLLDLQLSLASSENRGIFVMFFKSFSTFSEVED
jgi:hypothetical protein